MKLEDRIKSIKVLLLARGFIERNSKLFEYSPDYIRIAGCTCNRGRNLRVQHLQNSKIIANLTLDRAEEYIVNKFIKVDELV